jgi:methylenetetrahydrofolate reductase (NADPH)
MGVLESLSRGGRISVEVVPPARGGDIEDIKAAVGLLMPHEPAFVSVTDHAVGRAWADSGGSARRVALRTKPGTLGTAVAIRDAFRVDTVPHIVCEGADRLATEDLLIDLHYAVFRDLFVVRGDERFAPEALRRPEDRRDGYEHAADLVSHIAELNSGHYTPPAEGRPTAFRVGVAGYPKKHFAAPNPESDLRRLKEKVEAGASFIVTQMVFDKDEYRSFVARLREIGVGVPVVPGIKPVLRASGIATIPRTFYVDLPDELVRRLEEARSPAEERAVGLKWAVDLAAGLLEAGAPCLHFFTMGSGAAVRSILDALFGSKGGA